MVERKVRVLISIPFILSLSLFVITPFVSGLSTIELTTAGVSIGDWVKYDVLRLGQPSTWVPPFHEASWIRVDVEEVLETNITIHEVVHFASGNEGVSTVSWNLLDTEDSFSHYIIPANLVSGEIVGNYSIMINSTGKWQHKEITLTLNSTTFLEYGGTLREVNLLSFSYLMPYFEFVYNFSQEYCWDKQTGFLLERTYQAYDLDYKNSSLSVLKLRISDTNMWEMATQKSSNVPWSWALVGLVTTTAVCSVVIFKLSKSSKSKR